MPSTRHPQAQCTLRNPILGFARINRLGLGRASNKESKRQQREGLHGNSKDAAVGLSLQPTGSTLDADRHIPGSWSPKLCFRTDPTPKPRAIVVPIGKSEYCASRTSHVPEHVSEDSSTMAVKVIADQTVLPQVHPQQHHQPSRRADCSHSHAFLKRCLRCLRREITELSEKHQQSTVVARVEQRTRQGSEPPPNAPADTPKPSHPDLAVERDRSQQPLGSLPRRRSRAITARKETEERRPVVARCFGPSSVELPVGSPPKQPSFEQTTDRFPACKPGRTHGRSDVQSKRKPMENWSENNALNMLVFILYL